MQGISANQVAGAGRNASLALQEATTTVTKAVGDKLGAAILVGFGALLHHYGITLA